MNLLDFFFKDSECGLYPLLNFNPFLPNGSSYFPVFAWNSFKEGASGFFTVCLDVQEWPALTVCDHRTFRSVRLFRRSEKVPEIKPVTFPILLITQCVTTVKCLT